MVPRSKIVPVVCAVVFLTAGCLSAGPASTPAATTEPSESPSPSPTATPECYSYQCASEQPDPDKRVELSNRWNHTVEFQVQVTRETTGRTVHNDTHAIAPGNERTAYNVAAADPDGVEAFDVTVSARNSTQTVTIRTNECFGSAYGELNDAGEFTLVYAIC